MNDIQVPNGVFVKHVGENNTVIVREPKYVQSMNITVEGNAEVIVESGCILGNVTIHAAMGSRIHMGAGIGITGQVRFLLHEPYSIEVGNQCLFASEIDVSVSDMHSIVDANTNERINIGKNIVIEERVWIAQRAMILKGSHIGHDSVIGAGTIVSGIIPNNCIAAGNPARVIRKNIKWMRELL